MPPVLALLLIAGLLLAVPVAFMTRATLNDLSARLAAADDVGSRVERVDDRIRLAAAMAGEASATSAVLVGDVLPPSIRDLIGAEFDTSLAAARSTVDDATDQLGADELWREIAATRRAIDAGEVDHNDAVVALLDIVETIGTDMQVDLIGLAEAAGRTTGGDDLARSVEVARAASQLSVRASDVTARWGGIISPTDPPTIEEVERFVGSVAEWRSSTRSLEISLVAGSDLAAEWARLRDSESSRTVELVYDDTIASLATDPTRIGAEASTDDVELTPELLEALQEVSVVVSSLEAVALGSYELAEHAAGEIAAANAQLQDDARSERSAAIVLLVVFVSLAVGAAAGLGALLVRPLRRLSAAASGLSHGNLAIRARESGPAELRTTAAALNEALEALERAEAKAVALADHRPFDDEGDEPSGPLTASLDSAVARLADVMAEREELRVRLEHDAGHDGLTGLLGRNAVIERLDDLLQESTSCALLYLDLDGFKSVNDEFGHHVGDELLVATAERLRQCLDPSDLAGRLGGDEIIVILDSVADPADALHRAETMRVTLSEPLVVGGVTLDPAVSIGVAIPGDRRLDADQLIGEADLALYHAKQRGRARVELCDDRLRSASIRLLELDRLIDAAVANDEFELHYQPIFDASGGRLKSLEALVRWRHDGELIAPDRFIAHAERSHRIVAIDTWVLGAAVAQAAAWSDHPRLGSVPISVNLSGRTISNPAIAGNVREALARSGVAADRLVVEVTESSVIDDVDAVVDQLADLRNLGVRIALDDFGTGYMSLATLRRFDIDVLKIDRSFIARLDDPTDRSLVELMVRTGHLLEVDVIAEGIETDAQRELLTSLGVDGLQGFLLGRPADPSAIASVHRAVSIPRG